jgi:hypothetical protein
MTVTDLPLEALLDAREQLISDLGERARQPANRQFLMSFHKLAPDWGAVGLDPEIAELPALRWKAINLERLQRENPDKFAAQLRDLDDCIGEEAA